MAETNKIMHPVSNIKLRPQTEFGGTQVVDQSTNYERYQRNLAPIAKTRGSAGVPGAGHTVKTHNRR